MSSQYDTKEWNKQLNAHLEEIDPEMFDIIEHEKNRQFKGLQLIASENFTSQAVLDCLGSVMQNKYSEGLPGKRYYAGNEFIDKSELLCQKRALEVYQAKPEEWGVNVQCLSGSPANFYVYTAVLKPHDRILALDLPHGGHLSHGYQIPGKKISAVSIYFETLPYRLDETTGLIDYDKMEELALLYRPKLIVAGTSAYSRLLDYKRFREICDKVNAYLLCDMAHISGLVAAGVIPSPFEYADIVTTTTHKTLRGPRGAMIFFRKGTRKTSSGKEINYDLESKINFSVFPGHQGGPHNHTISALAVALKLTQTKEYKEYQTQVVKNAQTLASKLASLGYKIVSGGTDNHLLLVDVRDKGIDGARIEKTLDLCGIVCNKNTVPGDKSALVPGGIRLGSPALTTRGFLEKDFERIGDLIDRVVKITIQAQQDSQAKKSSEFDSYITQNIEKYGINKLREEVEKFSVSFSAVGFDSSKMKYPPQ